MEIEKNDVEIGKLFSWGRVFEIVNEGSNKTEALVYMRILGDADVNKSRVHALRRSGELRKKLLNSESDESYALFKQFDDMEVVDIINYIVLFSMRELTNQAYKDIKVKRPSQPRSDASLERMEKFQAEVDAYPNKVKEAVEKYIKTGLDKIREELATQTKEFLYRKYKKLVTDEFCEQEALKAYNEMEIYLGCYKDDTYTERFFDSLEQYENLESKVKADFRVAYSSLNIGSDELKKLREATR
jgi:hypothetical protein